MPPAAPSTTTFFASTTGMVRARLPAGRRAATGAARRLPENPEDAREATGGRDGEGVGGEEAVVPECAWVPRETLSLDEVLRRRQPYY
jgi:hypothetical protein